MQLQTIRKAIAAGAGVLLIGLLEYATSSADVERGLEQLVPAGLVPLVPIAIGGLATVLAVYRASNTPTSVPAPTVEEPAAPAVSPPAAELAATVAAGAPVSTPGPFWASVAPGEPQAVTSMVELLPLPVRSYE